MSKFLTFTEACVARRQALTEERTTFAAVPIAHTVGRLAALSDLSESDVRMAIRNHELPSLLVRRRRLVLHEDAVQWLSRRRVNSGRILNPGSRGDHAP